MNAYCVAYLSHEKRFFLANCAFLSTIQFEYCKNSFPHVRYLESNDNLSEVSITSRLTYPCPMPNIHRLNLIYEKFEHDVCELDPDRRLSMDSFIFIIKVKLYKFSFLFHTLLLLQILRTCTVYAARIQLEHIHVYKTRFINVRRLNKIFFEK